VSERSPDPAVGDQHPPDQPSLDQPVQRYVDVDGVRLLTSVHGSRWPKTQGTPLLIVTGLGASLKMAEPFARELARQGRQTISFDAPGVGESTGYRWPRRMPGVVRTIERMLDALGYQQVDVLGVSLGGVIAQQFAHQAPPRVRRLILAATAPGVVGLGGVPGSPRAMLALATRRRYISPDYYRRIAGKLYGGTARRDPDALLRGASDRFSKPPSLPGYLGQLYAISFWTAIPWLSELAQPTLVLAGDDDPIIPLSNGRILSECIPDARLHIVLGGGHLFLLERPAEIAQLVAEFLGIEGGAVHDAGAHPKAFQRNSSQGDLARGKSRRVARNDQHNRRRPRRSAGSHRETARLQRMA
jgi:poly(3-hydroxyalkanoate) depolymerase